MTKRPVALLALLLIGCSKDSSGPPRIGGIQFENVMVAQSTTYHFWFDQADSGGATLPPGTQVGCCTVVPSRSKVYRVVAGTHEWLVTASGTCSGAFTAQQGTRTFPAPETLFTSLGHAGC